jgi:hypothetical protein
MLTLTGDEHLAIVRKHMSDRRWSQVIRFILRGLVRPPEIAAVFSMLDTEGADDPLAREAADLLAADVAVGAGSADAQTRRRLLDRVAHEIETGERMGHRAQLLDRLAPGLSRREVRANLAQRFTTWLQAAPRGTWASVLDALAVWPADDTLLQLLWHALLSDDDDVQRTAGRVLSARFSEDDDVAQRLAELASTTRLYDRRAAATEALSLGWPNHNGLDPLIGSGAEHPDFAVQHASIAADLRRGNNTDANRTGLIRLFRQPPALLGLVQGTDGADDRALPRRSGHLRRVCG